MKAWRVYGPGDMRLDEVPDPQPMRGCVVIKIKVVQPSITEVVAFMGTASSRLSQISKRKDFPLQLFGHEFSGEVVAIGEGVTSLKKDSRVASGAVWKSCGECDACLSSQEWLCPNRHVIGDEAIPGCFAEYAAIPADCLLEIPDSVTDSEAACIQPLTACMEAVGLAQIELGDTVVVLGQGAIGLGTMQIARVSGAGRIITTARRDITLDLSKRLGADDVINSKGTSTVDKILESTKGRKADIAFETAGGDPSMGLAGLETIEQALKVVKPGGKVIGVSNYEESSNISLSLLRGKKYSSLSIELPPSKKNMDHIVHLLASKRIQVEPTITHKLKGLESVPEAFQITGNKSKYDAVNPAQVVVF